MMLGIQTGVRHPLALIQRVGQNRQFAQHGQGTAFAQPRHTQQVLPAASQLGLAQNHPHRLPPQLGNTLLDVTHLGLQLAHQTSGQRAAGPQGMLPILVLRTHADQRRDGAAHRPQL